MVVGVKLIEATVPPSTKDDGPKRGRGRPKKSFDQILADCIASAVEKGVPEGIVLASLCIATDDLADTMTGQRQQRT
jgi:hypothetical protein